MKLRDEHLILAFDSLINHFDGSHEVISVQSDDKYPLFVTWNYKQRLRGCLGTFRSLNLAAGIRQYSLHSALQDKRFSPITASMLPHLSCSVSVLYKFQDRSNWHDFEIGKHGIRIEFNVGGIDYSSVFLPNVLVDQGWNKDESITHLIRKAGYRGDIDQGVLSVVNLQTFKSSYKSLDYTDYLFLVKR